MHIEIPQRTRHVLRTLTPAFIVGGYVRDRVMEQLGMQVVLSKDIDIEVYMPFDELMAKLHTLGLVNYVGESFGVWKLTFPDGETYDVSLPRREWKSGTGHNQFDVWSDHTLSMQEAAERRDFTINTMSADMYGYVYDPYNGIADIKNELLRATSIRFSDDPLRVLRGMQFASRFGFVMDEFTEILSRSLNSEFHTLSAERIYGEFSKWARGRYPSYGLHVLAHTWLEHFTELRDLWFIEQDAAWHPEGSVGIHTEQTVDQAAVIARREHLNDEQTEILVLAALLHDVGKTETTALTNGRITSYGHAERGATMAKQFLSRMRTPERITSEVTQLVHEHMVHTGAQPTPTVLRRLANRLTATNVRMLALLVEADASGRYPAPPANPMAEWVRVAEQLHIEQTGPTPVLLGRHLIAMGMQPGPTFGPLLKAAFQAQLDGEITDVVSALQWVKGQRIGE